MHPLDERLQALGLAWPVPPKPVAAYVPAVRSGPWLVVSGQLPLLEGRLTGVGRVPSAVPLEQAQAAARQCALNALAVVRAELDGDWTRLVRAVSLRVFVASDDGFTDQHKVANGASELLAALLGEAGRHARAAVGVSGLPLGAPVEVELTVELAAAPRSGQG